MANNIDPESLLGLVFLYATLLLHISHKISPRKEKTIRSLWERHNLPLRKSSDIFLRSARTLAPSVASSIEWLRMEAAVAVLVNSTSSLSIHPICTHEPRTSNVFCLHKPRTPNLFLSTRTEDLQRLLRSRVELQPWLRSERGIKGQNQRRKCHHHPPQK